MQVHARASRTRVTVEPSSVAVHAPLSRARAAAETIGVQFVAVIVLGISSVLTARGLDPAGRGTYGLVIAISWIAAAMGHLSVEQANVLRWQRGDDRSAIASTSSLLGLAGGTTAALAAWLAIGHLGVGSFSDQDQRLVALVLPAVPLSILAGYFVGLHVLADRLRRVNVVRLVTACSQLGLLAVLWATGRLTVTTAVAVWLATLAAGPVLLLLPGLSLRPRFVSRRLAASLLRTGLKYHLGMAALFLLRRVDTLILNAYVSRREVGFYVVAVVLAELLFLPGQSIAQVVLPRQVAGTLEQAVAYTARIVRVNAVVGLAAALALAAGGPLIILVAYGSDFTGSIPPLLALLPGVLTVCLTRPITAILVRLDRPFVVSLTCITSLAANVALNLVLIPPLGVVGAALASSAAYGAQAVAYTLWLVRSTPLRLSELRPTWQDVRLISTLARRSTIGALTKP